MIVEDENGRDIDLRDLDDNPEPEPPDEEPLDLAELEATLADAKGDPYVPAATAEVLAAVPHLLSRLRAAEAKLVTLRAMPTEHRYVVVTAACNDPEKPLAEYPSGEEAVEHAVFCNGQALRRTVHFGPWAEVPF